jgi:sigma-B regulation protein RsbU (phosphoserine phosphatase)
MEAMFFERIRTGLVETRQNLTNWLRLTPLQTQECCLGPTTAQNIQAHLRVLDTAIAKTEDQTLGVCQVCHGYVEPELLEMDYTCCVCLDHLSPEERRRLEDDLELSQKVQLALLPQQVPTIPGLELAIFSRPAQIVGGDYFDFFHFSDGAHGLVIADVAGHGMAASLLVASVQTALRTLAPTTNSPADILAHLNRFFYHNIHFTTFVTVFLGRFEPDTRRLSYSNAGHNPPLHHRANGKASLTWLDPTAPAIGLVEEFQASTQSVELSTGDVLLLYTDGVTEATNPDEEQFGQERLAAVIQRGADASPKTLVQTLRQELQAFINGQPLADDTTLVVGKFVAEDGANSNW